MTHFSKLHSVKTNVLILFCYRYVGSSGGNLRASLCSSNGIYFYYFKSSNLAVLN